MVSNGGSKRSASSMAWERSSAVCPHRLELVGMGQQQVEKVARGPVRRLRPGREQQPQEGVDRLVGESFAVHLGRDQVADDVFGRMGSPIGDDAGEVLAQGLRRRQPAVDVGHQADELNRPALELEEVGFGEAEQAGDDPHGELESQLADELRLPVLGKAVDLLVDDRADELGLPAGQRFLAECMGDQVAVGPVLGVVHAQNHVPHHHPDGGVVAGRGERLGVAQDPRAVLVAVGDPPRLQVEALGQDVGRHGEALGQRGVPTLLDQRWVGVPGRSGHDVVKGGEGVVGLGIGDHCECSSRVDG